eukprot:TRINITY_DN10228_c0_g1_i1.p1 TRINITY_DN10228_c0_g1~~TRINITY_DN10228_c0_g1_i1.p1  ORF type:complete len:113 (+),score=14.71 TRINITY_DN10228_c0_g1_i1:268-606(+)
MQADPSMSNSLKLMMLEKQNPNLPLSPKKPQHRFQFKQEMFELLKSGNPDLNPMKLNMLVVNKWKDLDKEEREKYKERFQTEDAEFGKALQEYIDKHSNSSIGGARKFQTED